MTVLKIMYRFVYLALEKDKLKNLPKTVVCSLNNEGRVIFELKLLFKLIKSEAETKHFEFCPNSV